MRKTKIGFRRSDVYYFIYTAASNLSAQPCKSVRARQVPSARGGAKGAVYYKCRGAGSRRLCKGAGELVLLLLLLLRPTYLFCCKSQAATAKMLPLPFTPLSRFPLPALPLGPLLHHYTCHFTPSANTIFICIACGMGRGGSGEWGESSGELALFMHTPPRPQAKQPAYAGHWRCRASPGQATRGLLWLLLSLLLFAFSFSSLLFCSPFF